MGNKGTSKKTRLAADNKVIFIPCLQCPLLQDVQLQKEMKKFRRKKKHSKKVKCKANRSVLKAPTPQTGGAGKASQLVLQFLHASQHVGKMPMLVSVSVWTEQVRMSPGHIPVTPSAFSRTFL